MIELKNVSKSFKNKKVLENISLEIQTGEFFVVIGSSGCGKTTLLKSINKLQNIDNGDIIINGESVNSLNPSDLPRKIGYVVQEGGLFPHLTIADNIALTLNIIGESKAKIANRVDEMLQMVNLEPHVYCNLYPSQLSGGQMQRVGVARAFAADPDIILMDEPFSALDPVTRNELQDEVFKLQKRFNKTIIFVTHDMDEAIKLANRICIIQEGTVIQCDTPENILKHPANSYVEDFVGKNKLWSNPEFVKAEDIMLKKPYEISKERTVVQAIQIMGNHNIESILVTEESKLLGVLYLEDIIDKENYTGAIEEYISKEYPYAFTDTNLRKIITTFDYNMSGIIPVIDHSNYVQGYLTKGALLASLSRQFAPYGSRVEESGIIA
ncbi:ABC transporter ATP-binding protein [Clostridium sp.]|uniref:ABC transporter ATP-binding protein n=1 Tax=Clostridium sp. TaxID=1506 RepID=UPI00291366EB|nr:ABC transporter ATP-binding protein [Clostridium sp.]MDU4478767.1 ABC transporter ATP-binding protein [Clostridium sp.]